MGWQSWRFEGCSRKSPHNLVYNSTGAPLLWGSARSFTLVAIPGLAALARDFAHLVLVIAGLDPAIHVLRCGDPGSRCARPGFRSSRSRHRRARPGHPRLALVAIPGLAALA